MRPNQQNNNNKNRSRGRNNNNSNNNNNGGRRHGNPLSRNYESNGPDIKVRGNAAHVAEKYVQLARDAQASGDSVMAENYLQHAEHYFRIITAAQQQLQPRQDQSPGDANDQYDDEDDDIPSINDRFASPTERFQQNERYNQQQDRDNRANQPQVESGESTEQQPEAAAPVVAAANDEAPAGEGEGGEPRRHRERRGRRRRPAGESGVADPSGAPQPDVGELPAFITSSGTASAAE